MLSIYSTIAACAVQLFSRSTINTIATPVLAHLYSNIACYAFICWMLVFQTMVIDNTGALAILSHFIRFWRTYVLNIAVIAAVGFLAAEQRRNVTKACKKIGEELVEERKKSAGLLQGLTQINDDNEAYFEDKRCAEEEVARIKKKMAENLGSKEQADRIENLEMLNRVLTVALSNKKIQCESLGVQLARAQVTGNMFGDYDAEKTTLRHENGDLKDKVQILKQELMLVLGYGGDLGSADKSTDPLELRKLSEAICEQIETAEKKAEKGRQDLTSAEAKCNEVQRQRDALQVDLKSVKEKVEQLEVDRAGLKTKVDDYDQVLKRRQQLSLKVRDLDQKNAVLMGKQAEHDINKAKVKELEKQQATLAEQLAALKKPGPQAKNAARKEAGFPLAIMAHKKSTLQDKLTAPRKPLVYLGQPVQKLSREPKDTKKASKKATDKKEQRQDEDGSFEAFMSHARKSRGKTAGDEENLIDFSDEEDEIETEKSEVVQATKVKPRKLFKARKSGSLFRGGPKRV